MASGQQQTVNLTDLDLPQLSDVRKQLEEELQHLTSSFAQLRQAQAKFKACAENVGEVKPANTDKAILVPLTNSLYVPGKLVDLENVIIDVGTGYYVKKSRDAAQKHYLSKVDYVRRNADGLQETIERKQENLSTVLNVMQARLQAETQAEGKKSKK